MSSAHVLALLEIEKKEMGNDSYPVRKMIIQKTVVCLQLFGLFLLINHSRCNRFAHNERCAGLFVQQARLVGSAQQRSRGLLQV
jgi:hypothetical protein